jgi:hypothetical protein
MSSELNQSPEADLRRRKRRGWLIIGACFAGLLALFGWSLFGPNPPLVVSKQTTYITSPLRPDGTPDYEAYLLSKQNRKLPRQENAAVVMWQLQGPGSSYDRVDAEEWRLLEQELGSLAPDEGIGRLNLSSQLELTEAIRVWLGDQRRKSKQPQIWDDIHPGDVIGVTYDRRWTKSELPPMAEWVKAREAAFNRYLEGARRTGFYSPQPLYLNEQRESLVEMVHLGIGLRRDVARIHGLRGYHAWGERDYPLAAEHFAATLLWAKHFDESDYLVDALVSIAIHSMGYSAIQEFAADPAVSAADLIKLVKATAATSPSQFGRIFRAGERFFGIEFALQAINDPSILERDFYLNEPSRLARFLAPTRIDSTPVLELLNQQFDQLDAITKVTTHSKRQTAIHNWEFQLDQMEGKGISGETLFQLLGPSSRSQLFSEQLSAAILPAVAPVFAANDRHGAQRQLTLVTLALAIHRVEQGAFPEKLSDLVPSLAATLQVDTFQGKPLGYQRTDDGFLLYSFGPNGVDDGGDRHANAQGVSIDVSKKAGIVIDGLNASTGLGPIKESADDFSVRLPRPVEPWPWEINAANLKAIEGTDGAVELSAP